MIITLCILLHSHEKLEVIKGDVFDSESLNPILQGKDAVLSCLGAHGTSVFKHTTLYSESMKSISAAMERYVYIREHKQTKGSNKEWVKIIHLHKGNLGHR